MPHRSADHPRYITSIEDGLLVVIPSLEGASARPVITKTFRRSAYLSHDGLVAAAVAWRDATWLQLYGEAVPARSFHRAARSGSVTGIPGVRYVEKVVRKGERSYRVPCILAEVHMVPGVDYRRPNGSRSRLFSLNKFEYAEAIALAAAWRDEMVAGLAR